MRISLRTMLGLVAIVAVVCLLGTWLLRSQANDFWGYGKYAIGDGTASSPVYYIEVRGVGATPTFARVVKFADHHAAPRNALRVSHDVSAELRAHVRNADRWNRHLTLIAGRTLDEKIAITLDGDTATKLFAQPGSLFNDYRECDTLWDKYIAPHIPLAD